jgi:hypothetical protein
MAVTKLVEGLKEFFASLWPRKKNKQLLVSAFPNIALDTPHPKASPVPPLPGNETTLTHDTLLISKPTLSFDRGSAESRQTQQRQHDASSTDDTNDHITGAPPRRNGPIAQRDPHKGLSSPKDITRVCCQLALVYNARTLPETTVLLKWGDPSSYDKVQDMALEQLRLNGIRESTELYRKSGRCYLIRHDTDVEAGSRVLQHYGHWSARLRNLIMSFCLMNPDVDFHLKLCWEYSQLSIPKIEGEDYAVTVARVVRDKMKKNWEGKLFISRSDLNDIFSESTIAELVNDDKSLSDGPQFLSTTGGRALDKDPFVRTIFNKAIRILALCVLSGLPLIYLYILVEQGNMADTSLPLGDRHCPEPKYKIEWDRFLLLQGGFVAHDFGKDKNHPHPKLDKEVVVPIMFDEDNDSLGSGGFGKVFKVRIEDDHHLFSEASMPPLISTHSNADQLTEKRRDLCFEMLLRPWSSDGAGF